MNMNGEDNTPNTMNGGNNNPTLTPDQVLQTLASNARLIGDFFTQFGAIGRQYGLKMDAYEGGTDTSGFLDQASKAAAQRNPRIAGIIEQYLQTWYSDGGDLMMWFIAGSNPFGNRNGDFSITEDVTNLAGQKVQGYQAVRYGERPGLAPAPPTNPAAAAASDTSVNVTWQRNSDNESLFRVEWATNPNFAANLGVARAPAGATSYTVTGLSPGTMYYFRVAAANAAGDSMYTSYVTVPHATTTGTAPVPAAPTGLTAAAVSNSQVNLAWTDHANNEFGFHVDVSTDPTFAAVTSTQSSPPDTQSFGVTGLDANTTYYFRVRSYNGTGDSANATASATTTAAAPVAEYKFDEASGSTTADTGSGPTDNGTLVGGVSRVVGRNGAGDGAVQFNGSTGYVNLGTPPKFNITGQITVSAWIKPTAVNAPADIVAKDFDGANTPYYLRLYDNQTIAFGTYRDVYSGIPPFEAKGTTAAPLTDGNWHFVAGVYDGKAFKVYVDGVLRARLVDPYGVAPGTQSVNIGRNSAGGGGSHNYFNGAIDDVRIFNAGLSAKDVGLLASS